MTDRKLTYFLEAKSTINIISEVIIFGLLIHTKEIILEIFKDLA